MCNEKIDIYGTNRKQKHYQIAGETENKISTQQIKEKKARVAPD